MDTTADAAAAVVAQQFTKKSLVILDKLHVVCACAIWGAPVIMPLSHSRGFIEHFHVYVSTAQFGIGIATNRRPVECTHTQIKTHRSHTK